MEKFQQSSAIQRAGFLFASFVLGLVLFELVLQALVVGRLLFYDKSRSSEFASAGEHPVVICAGDSYTFGMGASDGEHSYPGQLEVLLREETGRPWLVKTAAFPGYDTAQALVAMAGCLREGRADLVVFCAGINDYHNHPEALTLESLLGRDNIAEQPSRFRLEYRTLKLVRLLRHRGAFRDAEIGGGGESELPEDFLIADEKAQLSKAWVWFWTKKLDLAEAAFDQFGPERIWVKRAAAIALAGERGQSDEHNRLLNSLWEDVAGEGIEAVPAEDMGAVLMVFRRTADLRGHQLVERIQPLFPENHEVQYESMLMHLFRSDLEAAKAASDRTVVIDPEPGPDSYKWAMRARIYAELNNPQEAARSAVMAYLADHNPDTPQGILFASDQTVTKSLWAETVAGFPDLKASELADLQAAEVAAAPDRDPSAVRSAASPAIEPEAATEPDIVARSVSSVPDYSKSYAEATSPGGPVEQVLGKHYRLAVNCAARAGAKTLLASYPVYKPEVIAEMRMAAESCGVPFTNCLDSINNAMRNGVPWDDLFIGDGHCNDRGYRVMAEHIFQAMKDHGLVGETVAK